MQKNRTYWEERCLGEEDVMAQMHAIIKNLQALYNEWKNKYANMVVLTNFALQDFPEKLKVENLVMCPENTHEEVFNARRLWTSSSITLSLSVGLKGLLLGSICNIACLFPIQETCIFQFRFTCWFLKMNE